MASVKLATVASSIKGFHVYQRGPDIGEKLNCILEETDTATQQSRLFWTPMKQLDMCLMDYLRRVHQH